MAGHAAALQRPQPPRRLLDLNTAPQCPSGGRLCILRPAHRIPRTYHHPLPEQRAQPSSTGTIPPQTRRQTAPWESAGGFQLSSRPQEPPWSQDICPLAAHGAMLSDPQNTPGSLSGSQTLGVYHQPRSLSRGFPGGSVVKNLPANAGDSGTIPGSGRSPREGNAGNPLQCSCLEKPMDNGAWRTTLHGVAKSRTQLSN